MNLSVERVDRRHFEQSRAEWNRLVQAMSRPSVFCTWEWIEAWWRHFGHYYEPVMLFISRGADLVGILPLALRRLIIEDAVLAGRALTYCGSQELGSDHLDIICAPADVEACLDTVWDYLQNDFCAWDVLHLSHLPDDGHLVRWVRARRAQSNTDIRWVSSAPWITLPGSFSEYQKHLPGDKRRDLNRLRRVLYEKMDVRCERYQPTRLPNGVRELFRLHAERAASKGARTSFQGEALIRFHEDIATTFHRLGRLRLYFLRAGEQAIAANYCFEYGGRFFGYQQGLDPEWEKRSVGTILMYELIREACEAGISEFDLLRGGGHHKSLWTDRQRNLLNVNLYNTTFNGLMVKQSYRLRHAVAPYIKQLYPISASK
ncbi:MAG: GNAT family N-acetyltransferase [Candidatus Competibacteraceae bacterium]